MKLYDYYVELKWLYLENLLLVMFYLKLYENILKDEVVLGYLVFIQYIKFSGMNNCLGFF